MIALKGIDMADNGLIVLLADTVALRIKTQLYHWNVVGPHFRSVHKLLEDQYEELDDAMDVVAEQARASELTVPSGYLKLTAIGPSVEGGDYGEIMRDIIGANEIILTTISGLIKSTPDEEQDILNLLADRQTAHKKALWMLKAMVEGE